MWQFLAQQILVFGSSSHGRSAQWPYYTLTEHGKNAVRELDPQPYDPDRFLEHFRNLSPDPDPIVEEYLTEAVRSFNAMCPKAASVMLGAASEQAMLLLLEDFEGAIPDESDLDKFKKNYDWPISTKVARLKQGLEKTAHRKNTPTFPPPLRDTINHTMQGAFGLIKAPRDASGHPTSVGSVELDDVHINLRVFPGYFAKINELRTWFKKPGNVALVPEG